MIARLEQGEDPWRVEQGPPRGENRPAAQWLRSKEQGGRFRGLLRCSLLPRRVQQGSCVLIHISVSLCPAHPWRTLVAVVRTCLTHGFISVPVFLWSSPLCCRILFPCPHAPSFPPSSHPDFYPGWKLLSPPLQAGLCSAIWVISPPPCWTFPCL